MAFQVMNHTAYDESVVVVVMVQHKVIHIYMNSNADCCIDTQLW